MKRKCPFCGKEIIWEDNPTRPFCSERCRLIDLGRWVSEDYRIALPEMLEDSSIDSSEESS
ncbi:MAG: DNA gyrase inhibitor YacG [Blastocatellia bacterium]